MVWILGREWHSASTSVHSEAIEMGVPAAPAANEPQGAAHINSCPYTPGCPPCCKSPHGERAKREGLTSEPIVADLV